MQRKVHDGLILQLYLHINKITLTEISKTIGVTQVDIWNLFKKETIPVLEKSLLQSAFGCSFVDILQDKNFADEYDRIKESIDSKQVRKLRAKNDRIEQGGDFLKKLTENLDEE